MHKAVQINILLLVINYDYENRLEVTLSIANTQITTLETYDFRNFN